MIFVVFFVGVVAGWFVASLCWAAARADLELEVMEQRARILNLSRNEP